MEDVKRWHQGNETAQGDGRSRRVQKYEVAAVQAMMQLEVVEASSVLQGQFDSRPRCHRGRLL